MKDRCARRATLVARCSQASRFGDKPLGRSVRVPNVYTPNRPRETAFPIVTSMIVDYAPLLPRRL